MPRSDGKYNPPARLLATGRTCSNEVVIFQRLRYM
jgi:hypothetical protein